MVRKRVFPWIGIWAIAVGIGAVGCSDLSESGKLLGTQDDGFRLAKAVVADMTQHQVVVSAWVTRDGAPIGGVEVAFSRLVSGRAPDYRWTGTTDGQGRVEVGITLEAGARASAMYLARAIDSTTGLQVGIWHSIPLNGGRRIDLDLPVGARAFVRSQVPLGISEEFIAMAQHFADYQNWRAVDYTIGLTNPASGSAHQSLADAYSRRVFKNAGAAMVDGKFVEGAIFVKEVFTWENGQKQYAEEAGILAMAKRGGGFNATGGEWEWFLLSQEGGIQARGGAELMGGGCNSCHTAAQHQDGGADMVFPHPIEYVAREADFENYRSWTQIDERSGPSPALGSAHNPDAVRRIYKKQLMANPDTQAGYPIGTIYLKEVQDAGEVVEITAMVKRGGAFNEPNNGWEWFMLVPGTGAIDGRGANLMDNGCNSCHTAALNPDVGKDYVFKHPNDPFNR